MSEGAQSTAPADAQRIALESLRGRIALRPREVALALGVALRTVEAWISAGRLPASKEGRVVLVSVSDLLRFLDSRRIRVWEAPPASRRERAIQVIDGRCRPLRRR